MNNPITELIHNAKLGIDLTQIDWEILLREASDAGSLEGVLTASLKLNKKPSEKTLENLLLATVSMGKPDIALDTCKHLKRGITQLELSLLIESTILSGNVEEFFKCIPVVDDETLAMLHTTMAIAVCRILRKKRGGILPYYINLRSWVDVYHKEFNLFRPTARKRLNSKDRLFGDYFIFSEETKHKFLGALIVEDMISKECSSAIMTLHF